MHNDWKQQAKEHLQLLFSVETYALALKGYSALTLGFAILLGLFLTGLPTVEGDIQRAYGLRVVFRTGRLNVLPWAIVGLSMMMLVAVVAALPVSWVLMLIARAAEQHVG